MTGLKAAATKRGPAGESGGSGNLSAILTADRAFPAAVAHPCRWCLVPYESTAYARAATRIRERA